jgi:hypothetical protein
VPEVWEPVWIQTTKKTVRKVEIMYKLKVNLVLVSLMVMLAIVGTVNAAAPVSNFTGTPVSGTVPLSVQFTDTTGANLLTYSQQFNSTPTVVNLSTNQKDGCEDGTTTGIEKRNGVVITSSTEQAYGGTRSLKVVTNNTGASEGFGFNAINYGGNWIYGEIVQPSKTYTASIYARGNGTHTFWIREQGADGGTIGDTAVEVILTNTWTQYTTTRAFSASGVGATLSMATDSQQSATYYVDNLSIEEYTPWNLFYTTLSGNSAVAPDGTTTATKLIELYNPNALGGRDHYMSPFPVLLAGLPDNTLYTYSVYAKPAGRNWTSLGLSSRDEVWHNTYFDISNGIIGSTTTTYGGVSITPISQSPTITSVGNGWYRCSIVINTTNGAYPIYLFNMLALGDIDTQYYGDNTSGVCLWGAQLEPGSLLTPYKQTTTATIPAVSSRLWNFGDGSTSTSQNPPHTFTSIGSYTVSITSTNADGSDSEIKTGYIQTSPGSMPPSQAGNYIILALNLIGMGFIVSGGLILVGMFMRNGIVGRGGQTDNNLVGTIAIGVFAILVGAIFLLVTYTILGPLFTVAGV